MASDIPGQPSDVLAIAFVVESSLTVANDWQRIVMDYLTPMLRRLNDSNPGYKLRMGFVTYATSDTLPSPILCKRFFVDYQPVMKEMREDPAKLGLGQTNSGAGRGMAALEGLVAAIELFDIMRNASPQPRPYVSHIFHIASVAPDASLYPQWNDSPVLDSVTWEDIPTELKKRSINFSSINLQSNLPRFSDVYSAVAPGAPKDPWFSVRPPHCVLLAGFPVSPQRAKRSGETHNTERTPDMKRQRLGIHPAPDASPKVSTAPGTPSHQPKPSPILLPHHQPKPSPVLPPPQPKAQPPMPVPVPPPTSVASTSQTQLQQLLASMRNMDEELKKLMFNIQAARNEGNLVKAEGLHQEWTKKNAIQMKLKAALQVFHSKAQAHMRDQANANQNQNQNPAQPQNRMQEAQVAGPSSQMLQPPIPESVPPSAGQFISSSPAMHSRTGSGSGPIPPNPAHMRIQMPPQNPAIASQMQKLVDQRARAQAQLPPNMVGQSSHNPDMQRPAPPQPEQNPGPKQSTPIWQGTLSWNGVTASGKKEMTAYVIASTASTSDSMVETWPPAMTLVPTREPAVTMPDLQLWIKRHKPVLCTFAAQQNVADPKANEGAYRTLVQLLAAKNIYAAAAWTRTSGDQGSNVLFFPINSNGLVGAFFPLTGIPDIPRVTTQPGPGPAIPMGTIPNEFLARMQAMTPEQQKLVMAQFKRQREFQLQQQQQQQQALLNQGMANANAGNSNNMMAAMNMANQQQQQQQQQQPQQPQHADLAFGGNLGNYGGMNMMNTMNTMGMGQPPNMMSANLPRPLNTGMRNNPGAPRIDYEMLQSFIQRSSDGSGGGMGPG